MKKIVYEIVSANREDAAFIARSVMGAVGEDHCQNLGPMEKVTRVFSELAASDNSQYSYRNALIAKTESGKAIGCIVFYDGARLYQLRKAFIAKANEILEWGVTDEDVKNWDDETTPDEIYIDSLYVSPEYRGMGIATRLIKEVLTRTEGEGKVKPVALLCDPENGNALALYTSLGFRKQGTRHFIGIPMLHLIHQNQ